jgi:hypothetical protein
MMMQLSMMQMIAQTTIQTTMQTTTMQTTSKGVTSAKSVPSMFTGEYALLHGGLAIGEETQQPAGQEAREAMVQ